MLATAAINDAGIALLVLAGAAIVGLFGISRLASGSARRSALMQRGSLDGLPPRRRPLERIDARLLRTRRGADLAGRLRSAGTELTPSRFALAVIGGVAAVVVISSLVLPPLLCAVAGALALWGSFAWLDRRLDRRRELFLNQLPEVARLLANGSSAGLAVPTALELSVRELDVPASEELQIVIDELRLGRSLEDSLSSLRRRLPSREIAVLFTTIIIQQRAGGDSVRALQELSETLDQRRDTRRETRTLMAGAMFTSYLIPFLGLGTLLILNAVNSRTLNRMVANPLGIAALVVAAAMYGGGSLMVRRIARIDL